MINFQVEDSTYKFEEIPYHDVLLTLVLLFIGLHDNIVLRSFQEIKHILILVNQIQQRKDIDEVDFSNHVFAPV